MEGGGAKARMKMFGEWSEEAVHVLIESYTSKFMELQRSNLKQKDWEEVLERLTSAFGRGYSYSRCRNKLDSLKKKYKHLKSTRAASGSNIKCEWKWYEQMEKLMGRSCPTPASRAGITGGVSKPVNNFLSNDDGGEGSSGDGTSEFDGDDIMQAQTQTPSGLFGPGYLESGLNLALNGVSPVRNSIRKRKRFKSLRCMEQMTRTMIEGMERLERGRLEFENKRLEAMKELELKRNNTNVEIVRYIVESCIASSNNTSSEQNPLEQ